MLLAFLLAPLSCFCYFWLPTGRSGQTLGKRFLKIKVVDAATGQPPSPGKAFGRTAVMFLLNLLSVGTVLNAVLTVIAALLLAVDPHLDAVHVYAALKGSVSSTGATRTVNACHALTAIAGGACGVTASLH